MPAISSRAPTAGIVIAVALSAGVDALWGQVTASEQIKQEVVSSLESTDGDSERMSFSFRFAPWEDVLAEFARRAGLHLDLIDLPPGSFSYFSEKTLTPTEALDVLNGYLWQRGYILVRRDDFLVSVNIENGPHPNLIPYVSPDELDERGRNELLTVVYSVQRGDVNELAEQVAGLLGPQGKAIPIRAAQALADIGTNLRRVQEMLRLLPTLHADGGVAFKSYPLENVRATDVEATLRVLLGLDEVVASAGSGVVTDPDERRDFAFGGRRNFGSRDDRRPQDRGDDGALPGDEPPASTRMAVNSRTNELLVTASTETHVLIAQALESIDVPIDDDGAQLHRFSVNGRDAELLIELIREIWERKRSNRIEVIPPAARRSIVEVRPPAARGDGDNRTGAPGDD